MTDQPEYTPIVITPQPAPKYSMVHHVANGEIEGKEFHVGLDLHNGNYIITCNRKRVQIGLRDILDQLLPDLVEAEAKP